MLRYAEYMKERERERKAAAASIAGVMPREETPRESHQRAAEAELSQPKIQLILLQSFRKFSYIYLMKSSSLKEIFINGIK